MPERNEFDLSGEGSVIGSFIHEVLEKGIKLKTLEEYKELAKN